jgi:hypothetical protein
MRTFTILIDGHLVSTSEQESVINPAQGTPFATCAHDAGGERQEVNPTAPRHERAQLCMRAWRGRRLATGGM